MNTESLFYFQVIECAKLGYESAGVELNRPLVWYSRWKAFRVGVTTGTKFYRRDIFHTNMKPYNTTILFGAEQMVELLAPKLNEMRSDTNLILCRFPLPPDHMDKWKLIAEEGEGIDAAWLYRRYEHFEE